mgnify:CR=1 FL=1
MLISPVLFFLTIHYILEMLPTLWPIEVKRIKMHLSCMGVYTCGLPWQTPTKDQEEQDQGLLLMTLLVPIPAKVIMP